MLNGKDGLGDNGEFAGEKEIVDADDRASERIFDRGEESVGGAFFDGAERGIKRGAGNGSDGGAEKLESGFFTESAGLALKGDAHLRQTEVFRSHKNDQPFWFGEAATASRVRHRKGA